MHFFTSAADIMSSVQCDPAIVVCQETQQSGGIGERTEDALHSRRHKQEGEARTEPAAENKGIISKIFLPKHVFRSKTGGHPSAIENKGIVKLQMRTVRHGNAPSSDVLYPREWKVGYMTKAELLLDELDKDFGRDLFVVERSSDDMAHLNHPAFKIRGMPFRVVQYKKPKDLEYALERANQHYLRPAGGACKGITLKTFKKDIIGMGFCINLSSGILLFKLERWNKGCYRLQEMGVHKITGSQPQLEKLFIDDVPNFYKDFGASVLTMDPITMQETNSLNEGAALLMMMKGSADQSDITTDAEGSMCKMAGAALSSPHTQHERRGG